MTRYRTKLDGIRSATRTYVCRTCGLWALGKVAECINPNCRGPIAHFPSKAEARRYAQLRQMEHYGDIREIELQPRFPCHVSGVKVCTYIADFAYVTREGERRVEDVKGSRRHTDTASALRRKLAEALFGITVRIVEI